MDLKTSEFLSLARTAALEAIGEPAPQARQRWSMVQLYFDDPRQHYELWLRPRAGLVEMGLHFEAERSDSLARIAAVTDVMPLVLEGLGPDVEAEEWTERWTRVHETRRIEALTEDYAGFLGQRLARYVQVMEPIVACLPPLAAARSRR